MVSTDNPADIISRGLRSEDLRPCELWWQGPAWLSNHTKSWPIQEVPKMTNLSEERRCDCALVITNEVDSSLLKRYSSSNRVTRKTAYCLRFAEKILAPSNPLTTLIIRNEHLKLLHAGCQTVLTSLRTRYWPIACKNAEKMFYENVSHALGQSRQG